MIHTIILGIAVSIVPHQQFVDWGYQDRGALYFEVPDRIYVSEIVLPEHYPWVVNHEDCHRVWAKDLTRIQRYRYWRYWRSAKEKHTEYGQTDAAEGYADNCAKWRIGYDIENTKFFK